MSKVSIVRGPKESELIDARRSRGGSDPELEREPEPESEPEPHPAVLASEAASRAEAVGPVEEPGLRFGADSELASRRAQVYAISRLCQILEPAEMEPICAWVEAGPCGEDVDLRMLCIDLLGKYLRTGHMNTAIVLSILRSVHGFAVPDTSRE